MIGKEDLAQRQKHGLPLHRRTGRTTRMLWALLIHASENADATSAVVALSQQHARLLFDYLVDVALPVHPKVAKHERRIILPNGHAIWVVFNREATKGIPHVVEDQA